MKRQPLLLVVVSFSLLIQCDKKSGLINGNVRDILDDFVAESDFSGYLSIDGDNIDTIKTCLSAAIYNIDTTHYMTVILSTVSSDPFIGSSNSSNYPMMGFSLCDKDFFVYNHTHDNIFPFNPEKSFPEKEIREREKKYCPKNIDDRFVMQTYRYGLDGCDVWIEKDSVFDFLQWLYASN